MAGALQTMFSEVHASTKVDFDIQEAVSVLIKNKKINIANPVLASTQLTCLPVVVYPCCIHKKS